MSQCYQVPPLEFGCLRKFGFEFLLEQIDSVSELEFNFR